MAVYSVWKTAECYLFIQKCTVPPGCLCDRPPGAFNLYEKGTLSWRGWIYAQPATTGSKQLLCPCVSPLTRSTPAKALMNWNETIHVRSLKSILHLDFWDFPLHKLLLVSGPELGPWRGGPRCQCPPRSDGEMRQRISQIPSL